MNDSVSEAYHISKALFIDLNCPSAPDGNILKNYALETYSIHHVRSLENNPGKENIYESLEWLLNDQDSESTMLLQILGADQETNDLFAMDAKIKSILSQLHQGSYLFVIFDNFQVESIWDLRFQFTVDGNGELSKFVAAESSSIQSEGNIFVLGISGSFQPFQYLSRAFLSAIEILPDGSAFELLQFLGNFLQGTCSPVLFSLQDFNPKEVKFNNSLG
jgi:hypothetical protein